MTRAGVDAVSGDPGTERDAALAAEGVALAWVGTDRAVIVGWDGEPVIEHIESGVTPSRRAVGSVRRGPQRPEGGGRVPGQGTESKHDAEVRLFLERIAPRFAGLTVVEVVGRGGVPERFAELLREQAASVNHATTISVRSLSRRPSDAQLKAQLRRLADRELPRRRVGRYRLPAAEQTTPTGKPVRPAAGRRTLRPPRLPEPQAIAEEVEAMLAQPGDDGEPDGSARTITTEP
jgi:hypothetical protein